MRLYGVDVSGYQGSVDWGALARHGISFAAIKATEGLFFRDPQFAANWKGARANGIQRLAYHFLHPHSDGAAQADYLHSYVRDNGKFLQRDGILLDLEVSDGKPPEAVLQSAEAFILRCREQIKKQVVLYTAPFFWTSYGVRSSPVLASCPLWIADYGVVVPPLLPGLPSPAFWQYSSTGIEPGVNGQVDLDVFFGNGTQLSAILNYSP